MMGPHPFVSVVIPLWNADRFLGEGIESVLAQTYDRWELFLVDEGGRPHECAVGICTNTACQGQGTFP